MNRNTQFDRWLLHTAKENVRSEILKGIWTYKYPNGRWEVHIPKCPAKQGSYWYGQCSTAWGARAMAIMAMVNGASSEELKLIVKQRGCNVIQKDSNVDGCV
jgi:hypothetical protein